MTARNRKTAIFSAALGLVAAIFLALLLTGALQRAFATDSDSVVNPDRIHYYTYDVENCNFGPDVYAEAKQMVEDGKASSILDAIFHVDENGVVSGIIRDRMTRDPALTAAITVDILNRSEIDWYNILGDRQNDFKDIEIGRLADQLHLAFLKNHDFWDQVIANDLNLLKSGKVSIEEISDYTSSMSSWSESKGEKYRYTDPDGDIYSIEELVFSGNNYAFETDGMDIFNFSSLNPPIPDEPEPTPTPEPEPTPEPKDPDAGPQAQTGGDNPDYGGGQNEDPDTTITDHFSGLYSRVLTDGD